MSDLDGGSAAPATPDVPTGGQMRAPGSVQPPRPSVAPPSPPSTGDVRVDRAVVDGWPAGMVAIDLERAVARRQPVTLCGVVYAPADGPNHSGVAGEPEATTTRSWVEPPTGGMLVFHDKHGRPIFARPTQGDSPPSPTQTPSPDPVGAAAAILVGGTVVSDEAVEAAARADHAFGRLGDDPDWGGLTDADRDSYRQAARSYLTAAAPLIAAQALRRAAAEIRSHISAPRARVATDVPLDVAAGIVERRADELERGTDRPPPDRGKVTADDRAIVSRATGGRIRSVERMPEYEED